MKLIIPDRYRQNRKKPRGKPERAARVAYNRLLNDDWSHVRRLERGTASPRNQRHVPLSAVKSGRRPDVGT
ncbi:hypothetical protein ACE2LV_005137, partial [Salmonella enterica]|nr:hypothetical protein [Salmonella enterica]